MAKITFMGAGSTIFAKNVLGDCILTPSLEDSEIYLYDIDLERLSESENMLSNLNANNSNKAKIIATTDRQKALENANYVVNAIQVGGYKPCTVTDFEIPKKYGLNQTIGDTLGIGGIFRALRTIPVLMDFAKDIEKYCPDALLLNYTNPMAILMGALQQHTSIKSVGLCHSVQDCASTLVKDVGLDPEGIDWKIAGINHQAWLLEIKKNGHDLYPEIKGRSLEGQVPDTDRVRHELMHKFGYYITESSEHNAEYTPFFIKNQYPELIQKYNIPLDEYPRRCEEQIEEWNKIKSSLVNNKDLTHERSIEYASYIMDAMETNKPYKFNGNVTNTGLITNLPSNACVEVPCIADKNGIMPMFIGDLPPQCAGLNMTNINVHLLTIEAAITLKKEHIYHAAMLDPHTSAELKIDQIVAMCNDLIEAHGNWLPSFR